MPRKTNVELIRDNPRYIFKVKRPSMELYKLAIELDPWIIEEMQEEPSIWDNISQREQLCIYAVLNLPATLQIMRNITYGIAITAVNQDGTTLRFVPDKNIWHQSEIYEDAYVANSEIEKSAIIQNAEAIRFVKHQTFGICLFAARNDPASIKHVKGLLRRFFLSIVTRIRCY